MGKPSTLKQWGVCTGRCCIATKGANIAQVYFIVWAHSAKGALKKINGHATRQRELGEIRRITIK